MRQLNLDQLLTLKTIVSKGGFTAAARALNLSQSAVSVQMRELEARVEVQLLERLGKKAYPTEAGRELIAHGERLLAGSDEALQAMRRYKDGWLGLVRIGASTTAMIYRLPPVLAHLRLNHASLELHLTGGTTSTIAERLSRNEIDLGVVSLPVDARGLTVTPLSKEPLVAIFPPDATRLPDRVGPQDVCRFPLLLESGRAHVKLAIVEWLTRGGRMPKPAMELDNLEVIARMVAAGIGASIVPEVVVRQRGRTGELLARPLKPALTRALVMVQRADKAETEALRIVRDAMQAMV